MSKGRKPRKSEAPQSSGSPAWMTTFSDMVTLLLTFFILLYSMSNLDAQKFQQIANSLQSVLSGSSGSTIIEMPGPNSEIPLEENAHEEEEDELDPTISDNTLKMYEQVKDYVTKEGLQAEVTVSLNKSGVFVNIVEAILFESGEAVIKDTGKSLLSDLEGLFLSFENEIVVEGHTDNVPHNSREYDTNWELSAGRALAVVRYLSEEKSIPGGRLSAIGYGEYRPIVSNDTEANRALNRRVNLLIIMDEGEE